MTDLKLKLYKPDHGWVPVILICKDKVIEFVGSDVPNNPIKELVSALRKILHGDSAEVWWHLEPDGYFFTFERENEDIFFRILFARNSDKPKCQEVISVKGGLNNIILPIWRSLKEFFSYQSVEPHWPEIRELEIAELDKIIKNESRNG